MPDESAQQKIIQVLARSPGLSRRKAAALLDGGSITLNGEVCTEYSCLVSAQDQILVNGKLIEIIEEKNSYLFYKPRGVTTTRATLEKYLSQAGNNLKSAGRLDRESEGLLIVSNDGEFMNYLIHPSFKLQKVYRVIVSGYRSEGQLKTLSQLLQYEIEQKNKGELILKVKLSEGRNRQIRKAMAQAGLHVIKLKRIAIGGLELPPTLKPGELQKLTKSDFKKLKYSI